MLSNNVPKKVMPRQTEAKVGWPSESLRVSAYVLVKPVD